MIPFFKNRQPRSLPLLVIFLCAVGAAYLAGLPGVPFHPDESSYIFTSQDTQLLFSHPSALFWRADNEGNILQKYRELDPPLLNHLIFIGRFIAGESALPADWNWSKTWQENQQSGALPSTRLLLASRLPGAILFPFSILLIFFIAYQVSNEFTAWVSAVLLASNALVLLHTRRAMSEGLLLFISLLTLWILLKAEKRTWLISIPAGLAFCAKQTLAPLIPVGMLAVLWPVWKTSVTDWLHKHIRQAVLYGALTILVLFLLNPFIWSQPVQAIQAAIKARQELATAQVRDRPDQALTSPTQKLVGMIASLYMTPPQFAETGNYAADTKPFEERYLANPFHSLFRSMAGGMILLALNLFGFFIAVIRAHKGPVKRSLWLLLIASTIQTLAIFWLIPLPWQRYYLPLVPYTCLWTATGIDQLRQMIVPATRITKAGASL